MNSKNATLIGLIAIFLWSLMVALIKEVSSYFGPIGGAALIYSLASIFLLLTFGWTSIKEFPIKYLFWGSILFVAYEICVSLSIGYSKSNQQAIEVGSVNYLWPTFTILFSILFNRQKANFLIIPGVCLAILGICWILGGSQKLNLNSILLNIKDNPLSYSLAFLGVVLWAIYCTFTARSANGKNGVPLFFILVSLVLWIKWLLSNEPSLSFELSSLTYLACAAFAMGIGYGAWNFGILYGNVTFLAIASYFIPVFSAIASAILLKTNLNYSFWQGTFIVCAGAILCWRSLKKNI